MAEIKKGSKVQALYDFSGENGSSELSITAGDVLTVTRVDVGEGWWEGQNERGQTGLFPAAYVQEIVVSQPPAMPPPPLPDAYNYEATEWDDSQSHTSPNYANTAQIYETGDDWDDEWDDDFEGNSRPPMPPMPGAGGFISKSSSAGDISSVGGDSRAVVGKKNFNRFSSFVKSGGESYILGTEKVTVLEGSEVFIVNSPDGVIWSPNPEPYHCTVSQPKRESKLKGLKSFIAYHLTPSNTNLQVSRRYKRFDWLHARLEEKFCLIPIPPLPEKQISGRYDESVIEYRKNQLQLFVDAVCRHPVLSRCQVWQHFLNSTDESRWKANKRLAEKDHLVGAAFFAAIQAPEAPVDCVLLDTDTDMFSKFIQGMDNSVKILMATAQNQCKKHQGAYREEYQRIGHSFTLLGQSFEEPASSPRANLHVAIKATGDAYNKIAYLFEEQPKMDWEPLSHMLHLYKGIITSFPEIMQIHKQAQHKRKECEKIAADQKMDRTQLGEVTRRTDVVSYALLAEMNHFHNERAENFKIAMKKFLTEQIDFYGKIVQELQGALASYDDC